MPVTLTPDTPASPATTPAAPGTGLPAGLKMPSAFQTPAAAPVARAPEDARVPANAPTPDPEPAPDTPDPAGEAVVEADASAEDATEDTSAETPDAEGEAPDAPTYEVEVTLPGGDGDGRNQGRYVLTVDNQQVADAVRFAQKQAARVPHLQEQVATLEQDATLSRFLTERPLDGLLYVGQQHPQAAQAFVQTFLAQYPQVGAQVLAQMGFAVDDTAVDPQRVQVQAELARLRAQQQVAQGQAQFQAQSHEARFAATAQGVWRDLAGQLGLADGTTRFQMFAAAASQALAQLAQSRPRATRSEMTLALQDLVREFQGLTATRATTTKTPPRDKAGQFTKITQQQRTFQKLQPPSAPGTPAAAPTYRMQPGETMDQWKARLRRGGQ